MTSKDSSGDLVQREEISPHLKKIIADFDEDHGSILTLPEEKLEMFLRHAKDAYYNKGIPIMNDKEYDAAEDRLRKLNPQNPLLEEVGAPIDEDPGTKHEKKTAIHPVWMPSLDKLLDKKQVLEWTQDHRGIIMIMSKLDGASVLLHKKDGHLYLYTRGKGGKGLDVSYLLPYLQLPDLRDSEEEIIIRAEIIIKTRDYEFFGISDPREKTPQSISTGLIMDRRPQPKKIKHLSFVAYQLIKPACTITEGLERLEAMGFEVVPHRSFSSDALDFASLQRKLKNWREASEYQMDGLVLFHEAPYEIVWGKKYPSYAVAFKDPDQMDKKEVTITAVEWKIRKNGLIKPRVRYNVITLGGKQCEYASAKNARYVIANKLGPGAKIMIIFSGGVNPQIDSVISGSPNEVQMPNVEYEWIPSGADIKAVDQGSKEQLISSLVHFASTMEIDGLKVGNITKLVEAETVSSIVDLWNLTEESIRAIPGFGKTLASKLVLTINKCKSAVTNNLPRLMDASNIFAPNCGEEILTLICKYLPSYDPQELKKVTVDTLLTINGIGPKRAKRFLKQLPVFTDFLHKLGLQWTDFSKIAANTKSDKFAGKIYVFTGFVGADWKVIIEQQGGKVGSAVSRKTTAVVAVDKNENSNKLIKARELGIEIVSKNDFDAVIAAAK